MLKPNSAQGSHVMKKSKIKDYFAENKWSVIILSAALVIFAVLCIICRSPAAATELSGDYAEYERAKVVQIISDNTWQDEDSDGGYRGEQSLIVEVRSGQYKGEQLLVENTVGPLYGVPVDVGDGVIVLISTYADGNVLATVHEFNRELAIAVVVFLFMLATMLVGGKTGAKSLIGLIITVACIFCILIPLLLRGFPTLLTVFITCAYVAVVSFVILGGVTKKTVCAICGTVAGVAIALLFGLLAQLIARIDGLRISDVEPLLQLRQTGTPIGLRGLLVGGITISALGAVMDVAMSLASSMSEIHDVDSSIGQKALFRNGMNIGRDMVGTMTNTLILAFIGSSFTLIIYLYSLGLQPHLLLSSAFLAIEVISGVASSIGVILSVPITALISSVILTKTKKAC